MKNLQVPPSGGVSQFGNPYASVDPLPRPPRAADAASSFGAGISADSFIFGPFLATIIEYLGYTLVSRWIVSLNRSASRFCNISLNCSFVVSGGIVASIVNLVVSSILSSQPGPI